MHWLPPAKDWRQRLKTLGDPPDDLWSAATALAGTDLDFLGTNALDTVLRRHAPQPPAPVLAGGVAPIRLAVLASSTITHLLPAIRVGGVRRGLWIDTFEPGYGAWAAEAEAPSPALRQFAPNAVLFCLDARLLTAGLRADMTEAAAEAALDAVVARIRHAWAGIRTAFRCPILHQAALPVHPPLLGCQEHRLPGSPLGFIARLNQRLREAADQDGVDILALDQRAAVDGVAHWHDPGLWHHAKQEIALPAAPLFGDLVARWGAAIRGRSFKCLVLDLDNTLWGGVVGDDGLEGIALGQGSAEGEAHVAFQAYARDLGRRGVILAVCSKNDIANALEPFDRHPDMVLRRDDIACFVANWTDKPANLRAIAETLNIGLDALVFADDNPMERDLVRQALPMIAVPELGDNPARYPSILAEAGYFDITTVTAEDRERAALYRDNQARDAWKASSTDMETYLRGLDMRLVWKPFDRLGLGRITQLINKSNQFNLTSRRYTEQDVIAVMEDPAAFGLQLRLLDRFGDNGVIAIVIGRLRDRDTLSIDTWLMSCRVLGRQVEPTTLALIHAQAHALGAKYLVGEYIPTPKNGMVSDHYERLGFCVTACDGNGRKEASLPVNFNDRQTTFIEIFAG